MGREQESFLSFNRSFVDGAKCSLQTANCNRSSLQHCILSHPKSHSSQSILYQSTHQAHQAHQAGIHPTFHLTLLTGICAVYS